jgi:hypothetical protein
MKLIREMVEQIFGKETGTCAYVNDVSNAIFREFGKILM